MRSVPVFLPFLAIALLSSCAKKDAAETPAASVEAPKPAAETPATPPVEARHVFVNLKSGSKVPGTIVASTTTDMVVAGDDGIERKIPLDQIRSVEYGDKQPVQAAVRPARPEKATTPPKEEPAKPQQKAEERAPEPPSERAAAPAPGPLTPAVTTKTFELPSGSDVSVRLNEGIDSQTATEGQTFDAQVTREAKDANGDVVIPRGSPARVVIRSASKGGRIKGASDLVLDLQSVSIGGKQHLIDTVDVTKRGTAGVGANRRTAEYTGGGAALGAIIGAIAGGGKGAAIGAGAGAGAGALTQVITKGRAIKVPVESVLTFRLDKPLHIVRSE